MTAFADLHLHTYYSDGRPSPAEVLTHAAALGLHALAITDHDNARGAREAAPLAPPLGLELIPAVEFTCRWDAYRPLDGNSDVDLLGYFVDLGDAGLQTLETEALADIYDRVNECCEHLRSTGYSVTLDELFEENPRCGGLQQLAQVLVHKGYAEEVWPNALALVHASWRLAHGSAIPIDHMIEAIHSAGGVAVLAHPAAYVQTEQLIPAGQLAGLVEMGLDGVEVYHFRLDQEARRHFLALARQFDLVVTGGSDEHGWRPAADRTGSEPITEEIVAALRERARS